MSDRRASLERTLRASARIALWGSLAATALAAFALARFARPVAFRAEMAAIQAEQSLWEGIDFERLPEVRLLQDYVRIDTSHPEPDELAGAEFLAARLAALGVPATIERRGDRRANLWAFVEGERPEALVLHHHIDVEAASEQAGWRHPPFGGVVEGPWVYGRGMYDMKSLAVAQLAAVETIVRSGRKPEKSLLYLATSSEEIGSDVGARWIVDGHPELLRRMWAVLTEGGVVESAGPSKVKYWGIEFAQKRFGRIDFCADRAEPLDSLAALLWQTGKSDPRPEIAPAVRSFLASYGPTRDLAIYQRLLRDPDALVAHPERMRQLPPFLQSLFRDELVPAPVVAEPGGGYRLLVAVHLLPGSELGSVLEELLPEWKRFGLTAGAPSEAGARTASPLDHPVYLALRDLVAAERPEAPVGPYFLPWSGTDARFFRSRGIPSYGFSPFAVSVTETLQLGKPNERMQLPAFVAGVRLYREAVRRLVE